MPVLWIPLAQWISNFSLFLPKCSNIFNSYSLYLDIIFSFDRIERVALYKHMYSCFSPLFWHAFLTSSGRSHSCCTVRTIVIPSSFLSRASCQSLGLCQRTICEHPMAEGFNLWISLKILDCVACACCEEHRTRRYRDVCGRASLED